MPSLREGSSNIITTHRCRFLLRINWQPDHGITISMQGVPGGDRHRSQIRGG